MDIEKLTKSQIVLLTLLVSFVTSIATGIVTVSLMQQAPPGVAQTVNRVVENTIETVATTSPRGGETAAVVEQKTVIVNDADLIAQAVKQFSPSVVRIYSADGTQFLGLGTVIDASGTVVSDIGAIGESADVEVETESGASAAASVAARDQGSGLVYLAPASSTAPEPTWVPAALSQEDPALGALVVLFSGQNAPQIAQGLVTSILPGTSGGPETLETDIAASSILPGAPIIDTSGALVGVSTSVSRSSSASGFSPASLVSNSSAAETQN